jgi:hypothetical protein
VLLSLQKEMLLTGWDMVLRCKSGAPHEVECAALTVENGASTGRAVILYLRKAILLALRVVVFASGERYPF